METTPPSPPSPKADWPLLILFALLAMGGVAALYRAFSVEDAHQRFLLQRLAQLQVALKADEQRLADSSAQNDLALLTDRVAILEKTTQAPAPVITWQNNNAGEVLQRYHALQEAVAAGQPYAAQLAPLHDLPQLAPVLAELQAHADTGVASEETLRTQLAQLLDAQPAQPPVKEDAALAKLNERLRGLISVQHTPVAKADAYAALRAQLAAQASLAVLITSAQSLDDTARAPLAAWLEAASTRQRVLGELGAAFSTPKPAA